MPNRKIPFLNDEIYHIFNRGTDKRNIFNDSFDLQRFFLSMNCFNNEEPIKSLWDLRGRTPQGNKLVEFICYCLNPNHYHFMFKQLMDGGISEFMKRIGGGYTLYFNERNKRSGVLFQGKFKAVHISNNVQLLHTSAYINLNNMTKTSAFNLSKSSWYEYTGEEKTNFCYKEIILDQFKTTHEYKEFALSTLKDIRLRKENEL
jgi:putative transposase